MFSNEKVIEHFSSIACDSKTTSNKNRQEHNKLVAPKKHDIQKFERVGSSQYNIVHLDT